MDLYAKVEKRELGFKLINPLLECEYTNNQGSVSLKNIRTAVEKVTKKYPSEEISVYYRDLSNGPWYGLNENVNFAPQSLLKIPVVITYLKMAEEYPDILKTEISYEEAIGSNLTPDEDLILGEKYQIKELIDRAITKSDNIAFNLLARNLPPDKLRKTHQDLGIVFPEYNTPENFVSVKSYSSLFRILYNASYLERKSSEMLLQTLTKTEFKDALAAGLPNDMLVAHKFGVLNRNNEKKQLHDCGIVYYPQKPYLLCVMTRGNNLNQLKNTIKEISDNVYQAIDE